MAGILFVAPGADAERTVFTEQGRGLWSAALPLVLEKHGYLTVEEVGRDALDDVDGLAAYDVVLVAGGPDDPWAGGRLKELRDRRIPLILDGPPTRSARRELGLGDCTPLDRAGAVNILDPTLRAAAARFGAPLGGRVAMPGDAPAEHRPELHWGSLGGVPISPEQAAAWQACPWDAEAWPTQPGGTVLMNWLTPDSAQRTPAVVRWQTVVACSFGLFSYLAYAHTAAPTTPGHRQVADRSVGLEVALLGIIDVLHRQRGVVRARVRPWPAGIPWVLAVRHDVTHGDGESVREVIEVDPSPATWSCTADGGTTVAATAGGLGGEVGLMAKRVWDSSAPAAELLALVRAAGGPVVRGAVTSRASDAFGFQGAPNVLWAEKQGFLYTDLLVRAHLHPHRFPALASDGQIETLRPLCLPHYANLDALTADLETIAAETELWSAAAGLLQARSDLAPHTPERLARLRGAQLKGAERWTLANAAAWWRSSHTRSNLTVRALGDGRFEVVASQPVAGLMIEALHPDGSVTEHVVDLDGAAQVVEAGVRMPVFPVTWDETWQAYSQAVGRAAGRAMVTVADGAGTPVETTLASVAARGERLLALVGEVGDGDLAGTVILHVGSGRSAGACYLAWRADAALVIGIDGDARRIRAARQATAELGYGRRLQFRLGALPDLRDLPDASIDVAITDGALGRTGELRRPISELARLLAPGGVLLIQEPNRRRRSVFTVQRVLRGAGLRNITTAGYGADRRRIAGWRRYFGNSFAIAAGVPGERPRRTEFPPIAEHGNGQALAGLFPEHVSAVFAHHVRQHLSGRGIDGQGASRTVRINSTLAERRARQVLSCCARGSES